jgi:hypothetical protein
MHVFISQSKAVGTEEEEEDCDGVDEETVEGSEEEIIRNFFLSPQLAEKLKVLPYLPSTLVPLVYC